MKIIAVASQKGGVGKTTISGHLSVEACQDPKETIALIDTDPQGSLSAWWNVREADTPLLIKANLAELSGQLQDIQSQGITTVFIDTPPAITESIQKVIQIADLVLVPTRPSPHDLRAVAATVDLIEMHQKPMVFIVNGASVRARMTGDAAIALSQHGRVAPVTLHHRIDYASSMIDGRTVGEMDPSSRSAGEVKDLWQYLQTLLKKKNT